MYDYETLFIYEIVLYAAKPFTGRFDFDTDHYGMIETSDTSHSFFYFYDSTGDICDLQTEFNPDGTIKGWNVYDTWGVCTKVSEGWTYAPVVYDGEGTDVIDNIEHFGAMDGEEWYIYTYDELFNSKDDDELDEMFIIYGAEPHEGEFDYSNVYALFETMSKTNQWFYFYDSDGNVCDLQTDFNDDGTIRGFDIADTWGSCYHFQDSGWTYSAVTLNGDGEFGYEAYYTGPDGAQWEFYDYDHLFGHYEAPEDFYATMYAAHPFDGYFDYEDDFALWETYTSSWKWFYYYDVLGHVCELDVDTDEEGTIVGYFVTDVFGECPLVYDGWTYMEVTLLDSYGEKEWPLKSYTGPDGQEWQFYTEDALFAEPEEEEYYYYDDDFYLGFYGATPFEYNHDKNELYSFLETYDRTLEVFFYYDSTGATC
jgi:catechol 2,3-dioxygenase-like lactoylglutathione lyase family enzyme